MIMNCNSLLKSCYQYIFDACCKKKINIINKKNENGYWTVMYKYKYQIYILKTVKNVNEMYIEEYIDEYTKTHDMFMENRMIYSKDKKLDIELFNSYLGPFCDFHSFIPTAVPVIMEDFCSNMLFSEIETSDTSGNVHVFHKNGNITWKQKVF